jgi:hypothetical protein
MTTTQILWGGRAIVRALDVAELAAEPPASLWLIQVDPRSGFLVGGAGDTYTRTLSIMEARILARDAAVELLQRWPAHDRPRALELAAILADVGTLTRAAESVRLAAVAAGREPARHWSEQ